ncbi:MAG: hypothetical protein ACRELA_05440 [Candidatus Rokuibacteriota bacterium]
MVRGGPPELVIRAVDGVVMRLPAIRALVELVEDVGCAQRRLPRTSRRRARTCSRWIVISRAFRSGSRCRMARKIFRWDA